MLSLIPQIFRYFRERRKFWLIPLFFVLVVIGGTIALTQGSVLAPFIYTLF